MSAISGFALGAAPIAGGALLGLLAGNLRGPDVRAMIKEDMELLDKLPPEDVELREALKLTIDRRIRDLIAGSEKSRELLEVAASYKGNWRDIVLFLCAVLFTIVWWAVPHSKSNWLPTFIFLIILSVVVGIYAGRGVWRAVRNARRKVLRRGGSESTS